MDRWSKWMVVAALALVPAAAEAQVFGQWTSARVLPVNGHDFGGQLEIGKHAVALMGDLRLSLYPDVDFGFQGGFTRLQLEGGNIATARLAADFRYQALRARDSSGVDVAFGAFVGLESGDRLGRLVVGPSVVVSRGLSFHGRERVIPYASAQARYTQFEFHGEQRNDFSMPLRIGAQFPVVQGFRISGEAQFRIGDDIDDHVALGAGVEFDI